MSEFEDELRNVETYVAALSQSLPKSIDATVISVTAKVPFKVLAFREALIWRTEELARAAVDHLKAGDLAAGITLARCVMESAAIGWKLLAIVEDSISGKPIGADENAMKLLLGTRRDHANLPKAINILTLIQKMNKEFVGIEELYGVLSDYSHPNYSGVFYLFAKPNRDKFKMSFGRNPRGDEGPARQALLGMSAALASFEHAYKRVEDLMPNFIEHCEAGLVAEDNDTGEA